MIFIVSSHFLPSLTLSAKKNILSNINTKHFIFYCNLFYYVKSSIIHSLNNNWYFWNFRPFQPIKTHLPWSLRIRGWNLLWTAHKRSPSTTSKKSPQPTNAMVSLLHSVYSIPIFYNAKLTITFIFFFLHMIYLSLSLSRLGKILCCYFSGYYKNYSSLHEISIFNLFSQLPKFPDLPE